MYLFLFTFTTASLTLCRTECLVYERMAAFNYHHCKLKFNQNEKGTIFNR